MDLRPLARRIRSRIRSVPSAGERKQPAKSRPDGDLPRFVFVVTYGRSGSTLVQGLLNALPGTLVRGENNFFILPLFQAWSLASAFQARYSNSARRGSRSAFFGLDEIQPDDFIKSTRKLVMKQLYGSRRRDRVRILGFKEVLWHRIGADETEAFFRYFEAVFPDAKYVLNRRDHEQVSTSGFWLRHTSDEVAEALRRVEEIQDYLRESRPDRTHDTRYELFTDSDPRVVDRELRGLGEFVLGRVDEQLLANLRATMEKGHGPKPFGRSRPGDPVSDDQEAQSSGDLANRVGTE